MSTSKRLVCAILGLGTALGASMVAEAAGPKFRPGEVVVQGQSWEFREYEVVKYLPNADLTVLKVAPGREMAQALNLRKKGLKASLNYIARKSAVPNDPLYNYQWHFPAIQAEAAWDQYDGSGVIVAVLDTGFQSGGPDGVDCVLSGYNAINGGTNVADGDGHGTHVSGTIAQSTNNGTGGAGLAYGACILPVKVLDDTGNGTDADITEGIAWAINNGAQVINMSLGYPASYPLETFTNFTSYAELTNSDENVTIVVASGNDSSTTGISYPASHPATIAVGATDVDGIAPYSNQGPKLDLVAPGGNTGEDLHLSNDGYKDGILQETYLYSQGTNRWGHYFFQGTSMATPHVAAAAAILLSKNGDLDRHQVLSSLSNSALDLGAVGRDGVFGAGLIQVADALTAVTSGSPTDVIEPGTPSWNEVAYISEQSHVYLSWNAPTEGSAVTDYTLERSKKNKRGKLGGFSFVALVENNTYTVDSGLDDGTYVYRILAQNDAGASAWALSADVVISTTGGGGGGGGGGGEKPCRGKRCQ